MTFLIIVLAIAGFWVVLSVMKKGGERKKDALAEDGDGEEQFNRGRYYLTKDLEKAEYWFEKAHSQHFYNGYLGLRLIRHVEANNCTRVELVRDDDDVVRGTIDMARLEPDNPKWRIKMGDFWYDGFFLKKDSSTLFAFPGGDGYWDEEGRMVEAAGFYIQAASKEEPNGTGAKGLYLIATKFRSGAGSYHGSPGNMARAREFAFKADQYGHPEAKSLLLDLEKGEL